MRSSLVYDQTITFMDKAMDVSRRRHNTISSNIANAETIGYRAKDLDFKKALERALTKEQGGLHVTNERHFTQGLGYDLDVEERATDPSGINIEPVDIDLEMKNLSENNILYRTSAEVLLRKIGILRNAIIEGGR